MMKTIEAAVLVGAFLVVWSGGVGLSAPPVPLPWVALPSALEYTSNWRVLGEVAAQPTKRQKFQVPATLMVAGNCFYVTSLDIAGNESVPSHPLCLNDRLEFQRQQATEHMP